MDVLRLVRDGGRHLRLAGVEADGSIRLLRLALLLPVLGVVLVTSACEQRDPELVPDEVLQTELGLTPDDRVHTVRISADTAERADPTSVIVEPGDYVQFVSADHFVHEVAFTLDSVSGPGRAFLQRTGQSASPPLLEVDARFVVSFIGAPEGRYPYALMGNRASGAGEVVVETDPR